MVKTKELDLDVRKPLVTVTTTAEEESIKSVVDKKNRNTKIHNNQEVFED